ncbi:MAG: molybdopterin-dependent oxidoreductase, partial [Acidobacteriia bacterium]|nr:molybdopterin-dependent oxidoreductase [Terriglobia bacterium]
MQAAVHGPAASTLSFCAAPWWRRWAGLPGFKPEAWDFRVWGEVEKEARLSWDEFNRLPRTTVNMDIHCV